MLNNILFSLSLFISSPVTPTPHVDTESFNRVAHEIDSAVEAHGPESVLVVFDIDNTLAATDGDIASEHWFQWQAARIKALDFSRGTVATSVEELLTVQGWILTMTKMHATEPALPPTVAAYQERGVKFMALTSRMPDLRDATVRELSRNGIHLERTAPGPRGGYAGTYVPEGAQKTVIYENGIMLTQGQHKGEMLRSLLAKTSTTVSAIVFVDDRPHHLDGVREVFAGRPEQVVTVRYHHESPRIDAFNASDKAEVTEQWCTLSRGLVPVVTSGFIPCVE